MQFSSCPGYLCLKITWNHVKKVMWDIGEKQPDVTYSDFHFWVVFSELREQSNPIREVLISSHHLTVDRRTGCLQFTSLCGLAWFWVVSKWISTFKNRIKFTLWSPLGFHEITRGVDGGTSTPHVHLSMKAGIWDSKGQGREGKCVCSCPPWDSSSLTISLLMETSATVSLFLMLKPIWPFFVWTPPHKSKECVIWSHLADERWRLRQVK